MLPLLYDAYTGALSVSDAAWALMKIISPAGDIEAFISLMANFVDNVRLALGGHATVGSILKMIPDFAMTIVGMIPGVKVAKILSNSYAIANLI